VNILFVLVFYPMGKTRFTTLDVAAMVREFRRDLIGLRLANVYDCGRRTFVLKLSRPDCKRFVLLESGVRIHTTEYARDAGGAAERAPSIFALKLRKLLRTKRLEDVRQLGVDRVLDFQFGLDDLESHLLVELYAAGNVVVTDRAYTVQMLLRSHRYSEEFAVALHEPYPLRLVRPRETPWRGALLAALRAANAPESWLAAAERVADYGSMLSRHALLRAGFDPAAAADPGDSAAVARLEQALEWCHAQLDWAAPTDGPAQGVLFLREGAVLAPPPPAARGLSGPDRGRRRQPDQYCGRRGCHRRGRGPAPHGCHGRGRAQYRRP
jgi:predicted ribosome quality control (RQC) complex YloA/Tae2 family protein